MSYNDEPVYYCKACISLHIVRHGEEDMCGNCGSMNFIGMVPYDEYEKIVNEKFDTKI